ncbi:universal stress protein [Croceitalea sp. MTPC9]|uniref:universal stress protein n=1 Tax=unclassified Croceitalea TaxID=2632280 RepID=UPI002B3FEF2C|nr:universal stress protein [Croceitalea sp. MTPC6]GMN18002.1 universal stress protein [Croceitalea sp. MTPC9]
MDKRILIPTDFSKNALNAIRYAVDLYEKQNCEFYFLNVFNPESYTTRNLFIPEPGSSEYEATKAESEKGLERLLEILKLHHDNSRHSYHTISEFDFLSEAIKKIIAKKDIDMVVMGTQGATGAKGVIFGSNTVLAMERIRECPILAVPEGFRFSPLQELVFPTDFKDNFKRKELKYLIEIAKMHGASVRVLHVSKNKELKSAQQDNKQLLDAILGNMDHSFHTLKDNDVAEGITSFVESRGSDMIAFINRKHFFFGSVFSKPLVKEIGYDATIPILALH